ncbi:MAG: UDP binding domain-containing protein, partial [Chitinophagales bacterium]
LVNELNQFSVKVEIIDACASSDELQKEYGFSLTPEISGDYDAVIVAVAHDQYRSLTEDYFLSITTPNAIIADIKGIFRNKINQLTYWSL